MCLFYYFLYSNQIPRKTHKHTQYLFLQEDRGLTEYNGDALWTEGMLNAERGKNYKGQSPKDMLILVGPTHYRESVELGNQSEGRLVALNTAQLSPSFAAIKGRPFDRPNSQTKAAEQGPSPPLSRYVFFFSFFLISSLSYLHFYIPYCIHVFVF